MRYTLYILVAVLFFGVGSVVAQDSGAATDLRRQARLFDEHEVRAGETAYSIARHYGISLTTLIEDNPGIDPTVLSLGRKLLIRKKEQGKTSPGTVTAQWEDYRDTATSESDEYVFHIVKPGETLYSLSRMYGVARIVIEEVNGIKPGEGLRANSMIRIPAGPALQAKEEPENFADERGQTNLGRDVRPDTEQREQGGSDWNGLFPGQREMGVPDIAVMLPFEAGSPTSSSNFVDFYKGALLALNDLKADGRSMNVTIYDTAHSAEKVNETVSSSDFLDTDLIIGPVYEDEMGPAVQFAEGYGLPIVSPLATVRELDSPMLYQMAPDSSTKYDKLRAILADGKNIILVSSGGDDDKEFESEITAQLTGTNYGRFTIGGSGDFARLIDWNRENVFVVLAATELNVDKALASISSAYNNASARLSRRADIRVVGSSRWAGYNSMSIDKNLFFKLNVCFVTSYYIDRSNVATAHFEGCYLEQYGDFPSRSSYRGYDAVKLFAGALFEPGMSFEDKLRQVDSQTPLQIPYRFVQVGGHSRHVNDQWVLVSFDSGYNITIQ